VRRVVLVTRRTRLEELVESWNTQAQARFYVEHMGLDFGDYLREHETYVRAAGDLERALAKLADRFVPVERRLVPAFIFARGDVVVAVGQDGLVANTAKYLENQPLLGVNPDPARWDGILLPFLPGEVPAAVCAVLEGCARTRAVTMAEARLNDGQRLLAFNDFFIGARTHVSARYRLSFAGRDEEQSSSGVLVSTGAGSTGWLRSVQEMAASVDALVSGRPRRSRPQRVGWEEERLAFVVREPFASRSTGTALTAGILEGGAVLRLESRMPTGGVLFSDGMEADALGFDTGTVAEIGIAPRKTRLVENPAARRRAAA